MLFAVLVAAFACEFAEGDGEVARGAFEARGDGFEFRTVRVGRGDDGLQGGFDLGVEAFGFGARFLLGARQLSLR